MTSSDALHDATSDPATVALRAEIRKWLPVFKATLGVSQNAFAKAAGCTSAYFARWLAGKFTSRPVATRARRVLLRWQRRVRKAA